MTRLPLTADDVLFLSAVGKRLGIRDRAQTHRTVAQPTFPAPFIDVPGNRCWLVADVDAWGAEHRRLPRQTKPREM